MKQFGPLLLVWGAAMVILLLTRELGTSLMFFGAFLALLYVATGRLSFPLFGLLLFALGAWFVACMSPMSMTACWPGSTRSTRTLYNKAFGGSYQLAQGLFAQADGGLLGTGFNASLLKLPGGHDILPIPQSDFIYAVITDETGLAGACGLLLTYLLFVGRGLKIAIAGARLVLQVAGLRAFVRRRDAGVRDRRRRHEGDPADRCDAAVRRLWRLLGGDELRAARAAAGGLRSRAPTGPGSQGLEHLVDVALVVVDVP